MASNDDPIIKIVVEEFSKTQLISDIVSVLKVSAVCLNDLCDERRSDTQTVVI